MASKLIDNIINYAILCFIEIISHIQIHVLNRFFVVVFFTVFSQRKIINIFLTHFASYLHLNKIIWCSIFIYHQTG